MKKMAVLFVLCMFISGCASQETERENNSPEPSEITQENGDAESFEPVESSNFDDTEYSDYLAKKEDEIALFSNENNLPIWSDISEEIPNNSYTIEYQRKLTGKSFIGYADYFDIIEKNNKIYITTNAFEACYGVMYIEITEEQFQTILTTDSFYGFIYSFTINSVCYYDIGIDTEREENEDDDYICIDGVPRCLIVYATCNKIHKFI